MPAIRAVVVRIGLVGDAAVIGEADAPALVAAGTGGEHDWQQQDRRALCRYPQNTTRLSEADAGGVLDLSQMKGNLHLGFILKRSRSKQYRPDTIGEAMVRAGP